MWCGMRFAMGALFLLGLLSRSITSATAQEHVFRHCVFEVVVSSRTSTETRRIGMDTNGGNVDRYGTAINARGTVTLDVVGATPAGQLIAIVSEDAESRKTEPIRVLVGKTGGVSLFQSETISEEEIDIARLFGRSFIPGERVNTATKWTANVEGANFTRSLAYRVVRVLDDGVVGLEFDGEEKMSGATPMRTTIHGKSDYDVPKSIARRIDIQTTSRSETTSTIVTTDYSLLATLKEDTVTPRTAPSPLPSAAS